MRIDINEIPTSEALDYEVFLNGQKLDCCVAADDEAGTVQVLEQHWSTGENIPDADSPYHYRSIELKGKVEITRVIPEPTEEHPVSYPDYGDPNNFDPYNSYYGCNTPFAAPICARDADDVIGIAKDMLFTGNAFVVKHQTLQVARSFVLKCRRGLYEPMRLEELKQRQQFALTVDDQLRGLFFQVEKVVLTPRYLHFFLEHPGEISINLMVPPASILMDKDRPSWEISADPQRYSTPPVHLYGSITGETEWQPENMGNGIAMLQQFLTGLPGQLYPEGSNSDRR
jgi:hypothetical protein